MVERLKKLCYSIYGKYDKRITIPDLTAIQRGNTVATPAAYLLYRFLEFNVAMIILKILNLDMRCVQNEEKIF